MSNEEPKQSNLVSETTVKKENDEIEETQQPVQTSSKVPLSQSQVGVVPVLTTRVSFSKVVASVPDSTAPLSTKNSFSSGTRVLPSVATPNLIRTRSLTLSAGIPYVSSNPAAPGLNLLTIAAAANDANSSAATTARGSPNQYSRSVDRSSRDDTFDNSTTPRRFSSSGGGHMLSGVTPRTYTAFNCSGYSSGYHTSRTMETLKMDLEDRCRAFRKTTAKQFRLKYELHPRPRYAFSGDPDRIADAIKNCLRVIKDSRIVALAHMRRLFQSVGVLKKWMKRWNEHRVSRISKILDFWEEEEKVKRRSLELDMATAFYRTHHTIQDTINDTASVNVPPEIKMSAAMLIVRRHDLNYVNKRTAWAKKVGVVLESLNEAKTIYQMSLLQKITLDNREEEREVVVNSIAEMLSDSQVLGGAAGIDANQASTPPSADNKKGLVRRTNSPQSPSSPKARRAFSLDKADSQSPESAALSASADTSTNSTSLPYAPSPKKKFPAPMVAMQRIRLLRREYMEIALQCPVPTDATAVTFEQLLKIRDEIVNQRIHVASKVTLNAYAASREERDKQRAAIYAAAEKKRFKEYRQKKRLEMEAEQAAVAAANAAVAASAKSKGRGRGRITASVETLVNLSSNAPVSHRTSSPPIQATHCSSDDEAGVSIGDGTLLLEGTLTSAGETGVVTPPITNTKDSRTNTPTATRSPSASPGRQTLPSQRSSAASGRRGTLTRVLSLSSTLAGTTTSANAVAEQLAVSLARTVSLPPTCTPEDTDVANPEHDFSNVRRLSSINHHIDRSPGPNVSLSPIGAKRVEEQSSRQASPGNQSLNSTFRSSIQLQLAATYDVLGISKRQELSRGRDNNTSSPEARSLLPPKPHTVHDDSAIVKSAVNIGSPQPTDTHAGLPASPMTNQSTLSTNVHQPSSSNIRIRLPNNSLLHYESMLDGGYAVGNRDYSRASSPGRLRAGSLEGESVFSTAVNANLRQSDLSVQLRPHTSMSLRENASRLAENEHIPKRRGSLFTIPKGNASPSFQHLTFNVTPSTPATNEDEVAQQKMLRTLNEYSEDEYAKGARANVPAVWSGQSSAGNPSVLNSPPRTDNVAVSGGSPVTMASPSSPFLHNHRRHPTHPEHNQLFFTSPLRPSCKLTDISSSVVLRNRVSSASGARPSSAASSIANAPLPQSVMAAPPLGYLARQPQSELAHSMLDGGALSTLRNAKAPSHVSPTFTGAEVKKAVSVDTMNPATVPSISKSVLLRAAALSSAATPNNATNKLPVPSRTHHGHYNSPLVTITRSDGAVTPTGHRTTQVGEEHTSSRPDAVSASVSTTAFTSTTALPYAGQSRQAQEMAHSPNNNSRRQFNVSFLNRDKKEALRQATGFAFERRGAGWKN